MDYIINLLIIAVCFVLIIWGGDKFVDASVSLAKKGRIPTVVIGATITSIGTTLPELLVTIFSSAGEASGLALGNALGSVIFNSCIIGGILLLFLTAKAKGGNKITLCVLIFSILLISVMSINKVLSIRECILLLVLFGIFMIINFKNAKEQQEPEQQNAILKPIWQIILMFVLSAASIAVGAYFSVESAKTLAKLIGLSDTIIGLTIISFGTSLPELITTITSIRKKESGLGLGNIIGSNIINLLLLTSITGIMSGGLPLNKQTLLIGIPFALISTLLLVVPTIIKGRTYKWQGKLLILSYVIYFALLVLSTFNWV